MTGQGEPVNVGAAGDVVLSTKGHELTHGTQAGTHPAGLLGGAAGGGAGGGHGQFSGLGVWVGLGLGERPRHGAGG